MFFWSFFQKTWWVFTARVPNYPQAAEFRNYLLIRGFPGAGFPVSRGEFRRIPLPCAQLCTPVNSESVSGSRIPRIPEICDSRIPGFPHPDSRAANSPIPESPIPESATHSPAPPPTHRDHTECVPQQSSSEVTRKPAGNMRCLKAVYFENTKETI